MIVQRHKILKMTGYSEHFRGKAYIESPQTPCISISEDYNSRSKLLEVRG